MTPDVCGVVHGAGLCVTFARVKRTCARISRRFIYTMCGCPKTDIGVCVCVCMFVIVCECPGLRVCGCVQNDHQ